MHHTPRLPSVSAAHHRRDGVVLDHAPAIAVLRWVAACEGAPRDRASTLWTPAWLWRLPWPWGAVSRGAQSPRTFPGCQGKEADLVPWVLARISHAVGRSRRLHRWGVLGCHVSPQG